MQIGLHVIAQNAKPQLKTFQLEDLIKTRNKLAGTRAHIEQIIGL